MKSLFTELSVWEHPPLPHLWWTRERVWGTGIRWFVNNGSRDDAAAEVKLFLPHEATRARELRLDEDGRRHEIRKEEARRGIVPSCRSDEAHGSVYGPHFKRWPSRTCPSVPYSPLAPVL